MKSLHSDYCRPFLQCKIRAALASPQTSTLYRLSQHLFSEAWLPRWISVSNFERLHFKRLGGEKNHGTRVLLLSSWRIDASRIKTAACNQWDSHILGLPIKLSYCCSVWLASLGCCHILWQCSHSPQWGQSARSTITHLLSTRYLTGPGLRIPRHAQGLQYIDMHMLLHLMKQVILHGLWAAATPLQLI